MLTAGLVYQPRFLKGFDIAVDYYASTIEDEIGVLPASLILSNCYSQDSPSNCDQVVRDPNTKLITYIASPNANIGQTATSGFDIGLNYIADAPVGIVSAQFESNLLVKYEQTLPSANGPELVKGKGYYDLGVFPTWRHTASVGLAKQRFSIGLTWRYVGGFEECEDDDCKGKYRSDVEEVPPSRKVDSHSLFNVRGSYELGTALGLLHTDHRHQQSTRSAAGGDLQWVPRHFRFQHVRLYGPLPIRAPVARSVGPHWLRWPYREWASGLLTANNRTTVKCASGVPTRGIRKRLRRRGYCRHRRRTRSVRRAN